MSDLRLVVFDVDGTLVDSQAHILAAMARAFAAAGRPSPSREAVLGIVGLSLPVAMARLSPEAPSDVPVLVDAYREAFATLRLSGDGAALSPLYPGALDCLRALSSEPWTLLGVATGKSRRGLDKLLEAHDLGRYFVTRQVSDHHPSKPHPAMLHAALSDIGVNAADAVMIGDTSFDMEMAHAAGMAGIGVSWGYHPRQALHLAERIIDDFSDLPNCLTNLWETAS